MQIGQKGWPQAVNTNDEDEVSVMSETNVQVRLLEVSWSAGCVVLTAKRTCVSLILCWPAIVSACPEQSRQHSHACKHQQTKYTKSMHGYFW